MSTTTKTKPIKVSKAQTGVEGVQLIPVRQLFAEPYRWGFVWDNSERYVGGRTSVAFGPVADFTSDPDNVRSGFSGHANLMDAPGGMLVAVVELDPETGEQLR